MEKYRVILLMAVLAVLIVFCQCDPEPKHRVIRAVTSTVKPTTKKTTAKATTKKATTKKAATTVGPIRLAVFGAVEETDEETTSAQQVLATTKKTTIATGRPRKTTVRYIDNDGLTYHFDRRFVFFSNSRPSYFLMRQPRSQSFGWWNNPYFFYG